MTREELKTIEGWHKSGCNSGMNIVSREIW